MAFSTSSPNSDSHREPELSGFHFQPRWVTGISFNGLTRRNVFVLLPPRPLRVRIDFLDVPHEIINSRLYSGMWYNRVMKTQPNKSTLKPQPVMPHFRGLCLLSACLMLAWTGCRNEAGSNANLDPTGVYALVSVDGKSLPCELNHEGAALTIKSGVFTIKADSNCISQITFSVPTRGDMTREVKATYTRQGADLTMQWEGAGMTMGNVNGNAFTMTNEGMVFAYRK